MFKNMQWNKLHFSGFNTDGTYNPITRICIWTEVSIFAEGFISVISFKYLNKKKIVKQAHSLWSFPIALVLVAFLHARETVDWYISHQYFTSRMSLTTWFLLRYQVES